jgi:MYXO-CTERM domain-containing protein
MRSPSRSLAFRTSLLLAATFASAMSAVVMERSARACSPLLHVETQTAPKDGESLPASAPGILVRGEGGITVELLDQAKASVPGSLKEDGGRRYFAPTASLAPGAYTLRYDSWAPGGPDAPSTVEAAIAVTAAVALPTKAGTLSIAGSERKHLSEPCAMEMDASIVHLAFTPDAALAPYAEVLAWETTVDGKAWGRGQGKLPAADDPTSRLLNVLAVCDADAGTGGTVLAPGTHVVQLKPILVGSATEIEPATISVTLSCSNDVDTDAGPSADAGPGTAPPGAGATPDDDAAATASGCTASPARGASGVATLVLAGLGFIAARRRRAR